MTPVQIIIPTYNNLDYLLPCLDSIVRNTVDSCRLIIVNNGSKELENYVKGPKVLHSGKNRGWMGGINDGLKEVPEDCEYVLLMNDDTLILPHHYDWIAKMKKVMDIDPSVAAVGPSSNVVAGIQNMRHKGLPALLEVKYLIGFCVLIRKKYLDEIGGLDESLPGGDDLDWSIAFRKKGYKLIARRDVFVFHHGFVTGNKVRGDHTQHNGWNSPQMTEETNHAIIRKHGFRHFVETTRNEPLVYDGFKEEYDEGNCFENILKGKGLDIGCGGKKISPETIGVDLIARGDMIGGFGGMAEASEADVKASGDNLHMFDDDSIDYVVARHNIEHYANPIKALREWIRVLKPGGKIGISTPDDTRLDGMRLDKTHKHSFNRESMKDMLELLGLKIKEMGGTANQWNFFVIAEKN